MRGDEFGYHVLEPPFPEDFVAWYPYVRREVLADHPRWLSWLERVVLHGVPGVRDRMIAARHRESGEWVGVVWTSVSVTCPEVAHFGWFYVEDRCRGAGVGGRVIETCLSTLAAEGVRVIMLPTQLENERAIGMYYRRGWELSIADPTGGVWMVREPPGFYQRYFTPDATRPLQTSTPEPADFVALDYLLSRPQAAIRLLPLGLTGSRRFISFVHDWGGAEHVVARQGGKPVAFGAAVRTDRGSQLDAFGLERRGIASVVRALARSVPQPYAEVAATDGLRRAALEDAQLRLDTVREAVVAGATMSLCRYVR